MSKPIIFQQGLSTNLDNLAMTDGQIIFTTDDKRLYLDIEIDSKMYRLRINADADTAIKAFYDSVHTDKTIAQTYFSEVSVNGTKITFKKGDGGVTTIDTKDTVVVFKNENTNQPYSLVFSGTGKKDGEIATEILVNDNITVNPSTKTISANLDGNAKTASKASLAIKAVDADGTEDANSIRDTYFSDISISGKNITLKTPSGKTDSITIGNATTADKLGTSAGDSNTPVYFSGGKPVAVTGLDLDTTGKAAKADAWTNAINFQIKDADSSNEGVATSVDGSSAVTLKLPGTIKATLEGNAKTATTAEKLSTSAGSSKKPVYFENGVPKEVSSTLDISISGNAKTATSATHAQTATDATNAFGDELGENIRENYAGSLTSSGTTLILKSKSGLTLSSITTQDSNVAQTLVSDNAEYPLLLTPKAQKDTTTTTAAFNSGVTLNPSTKTISASISGNAKTATSATTAQKALGDSLGEGIRENYAASLTASGTTLILKSKDGTTLSTVTTKDTNTDTKVTQTLTDSSGTYPLLLAPSGQAATTTGEAYFDSGVTLNPKTNTIAASISGNAATATAAEEASKATYDGTGTKEIRSYLDTIDLTSRKLVLKDGKGDSKKEITLPTDVKQNLTNEDKTYPILLAPNGQTTSATKETYFDSGVTLNPHTNTIAANISGNAATADEADEALYAVKAMDADGVLKDTNSIRDTYVSKVEVSGRKLTFTTPTGNKVAEFNTQDTNTKVTQTLVANDKDASYPVLLAPTGQTTTQTTTSNFTTELQYNPSTNVLSTDISGNAETATSAEYSEIAKFAGDGTVNDANPIRSTYVSQVIQDSTDTTKLTFKAPDGTLIAELHTKDTNTDANVKQTVTSSAKEYPLLLAPTGQTATKTTGTYFDSGVTLNPSTNTITAKLKGNAETATDASYANIAGTSNAHDELPIRETYFSTASISGNEISLGKPGVGTSATVLKIEKATVADKLASGAGDSNTPIYINASGIPQPVTGLDLDTTGNANTASKLAKSVNIGVTDGTNSGSGIAFDGSSSITLPLPGTIKATLDGNAKTATSLSNTSAIGSTTKPVFFNASGKPQEVGSSLDVNISKNAKTATTWETARNFSIASSDGTGAGVATTGVNGAADVTIKLPATIKATLDGNAKSATSATNATSATTAEKLSTSSGSTTLPVYFKDGKPVATSSSLAVSITGSAKSAEKATTATYDPQGKEIRQYVAGGTLSGTNLLLQNSYGSAASTINLSGLKPNNAGTADKLGTNAGTTERPVYFSGGIPVQTSSTLDVSIKGNAATADAWTSGVTFQISDANGSYAGTGTTVDGSENVVLKLPSTIKATLSGTASSATQAAKLTTSSGSTTVPVYFSGGKPVAVTGLSLDTTGSAASAGKWTSGVNFAITDAHGSYTGTATTGVDGSENVTLKLPTTIKADLEGNISGSAKKLANTSAIGSLTKPVYFTSDGVPEACGDSLAVSITGSAATAGKADEWTSAVNISIANSDGSGAGTAVSVNGGSSGVTLKLPSTIKGSFSGSLNGTATYATSAGSAATAATAAKLSTSSGSTTRPVYFKDGVPVQTSSSLAVSITGNAATATKATYDGRGTAIQSYLAEVYLTDNNLYTKDGYGNPIEVGKFALLDTEGKLPLSVIPSGATPTLKIVSSIDDIKKLTINDVQNGDVVLLDNPNATNEEVMYYVFDDSKLATSASSPITDISVAFKPFSAGLATKAVYDANGAAIASSYAGKIEKSSSNDEQFVLKTPKGGALSTITVPDKKVNQNLATSSAEYPLLAAKFGTTATTRGEAYFGTGITVNPSTKTITANTFKGSLSGLASSATTATIALNAIKAASQGSDGTITSDEKSIRETYFSKVTSSGPKITFATPLNSSAAVVTINNVETANKLETNAGSTTVPVYFEGGIPKAVTKLSLDTTGSAASAGKWTSAINIAIASSNGSGAGAGVSVNGSTGVTLKLPSTITATLNGAAAKLANTSAIGGTTQPVYFTSAGVPTPIGYTIAKSVPSDAKFTDTTYSKATTTADGLMPKEDKQKLNYTNIAFGTCDTAAATAVKDITINDENNQNWALVGGAMITVIFTETNTAQNPQFNVNGTGARDVYYTTTQITTKSLSYAGYKNRPMTFVYDGAKFIFVGWGYDGNTDTKVTQNEAITTSGEYPILLAYSTATTSATNVVNKTSTLKYNPSTQKLTVPYLQGLADSATYDNGSGAKKKAIRSYVASGRLSGTTLLLDNADGGTASSIDLSGLKTADRLGTSTGTAERPVYFSNGIPVQTSSTLDVSIKGSANSANSAGKWTSGITFEIKDAHGSYTGSATSGVDGSKNVTLNLPSTIKANLEGTASSATKAAALTTSAGSATRPVFINASGKPEACGDSLAVSITGKATTAGTADLATSATSATRATYAGDDTKAIQNTYVAQVIQDSTDPTLLTFKSAKGDKIAEFRTQDTNTNTDTKVNVKLNTTTKAYLLATTTAPTASNAAVESIADTGVYLGTTSGEIVATKFNGTATNATKATYDSGGTKTIRSYVAGGALNSTTTPTGIILKNADGSGVSTITLTGIKPTNATTADKLGTNAGTTEKPVYFSNGIPEQCSDTLDVSIKGNAATATAATYDNGSGASQKAIRSYVASGALSGTNLLLKDADGDTASTVALDGLKPTNAGTADKLGTSSGSTTLPVYFKDGKPVATSSTLGVSITGNAETATKATGDASGNDIKATYANSFGWNSTATNDTILKLKNKNGGDLSSVDLGARLLELTGGTMSGKLSANGGISLNNSTNSGTLQYILGIKPFAEGGDVLWQSASEVSVGKAAKADTWTTARNFQIKDTATTANVGTAVSVNGGAAVQLPLPTNIQANSFNVGGNVVLSYNTTDECLEFTFS